MAKERVQKVLARAGVASRRGADELVKAGRVRVGGRVVDELGTRVDPEHDEIEVDGRRIELEPLVYLLFHKPREVMCTMRDPQGRPSVADYVKGVGVRVVPVGRLDYQTSGVLLLTNDGAFARNLLHPSSGVRKEYTVKLQGRLDAQAVSRFRHSISIDGRQTRPAEIADVRHEADKTWLSIVLREGKNRQIRRLAEHAGHRVMRLTRTRFAGLTADGLKPGEWRHLTPKERKALEALVSARAPASSDHP